MADSESSAPTEAQFAPGQIVRHLRFEYRGVVVDVDSEFAGTEEWYETVARSRPPRDKPWYHVLVDGADHSTYVAERHLELDPDRREIRHPLLFRFFDHFRNGHYGKDRGLN